MGRKNFKKRNDRLENRVEVGVKTVLERDLPHTSLLLLISARPVEEWRTSFRPPFPKPLRTLTEEWQKTSSQPHEGGVPGCPEQK
jgi:hypothetical protein